MASALKNNLTNVAKMSRKQEANCQSHTCNITVLQQRLSISSSPRKKYKYDWGYKNLIKVMQWYM